MEPSLPAWIASHLATAIAIFFMINAILVAFVILLENREPERSHSWLLVLFFFPFIGFILYVFFGHNWHRKSREARRLAVRELEQRKQTALLDAEKLPPEASVIERRIRFLSTSTTGFPMAEGNSIRILTDAHEKYPRLLSALRSAKHSIDIDYYIFRHDAIGIEIINILAEKAKSGVRVRFLVDGMGSLGLGRKAFAKLRDAGVRAHYFAPLATLFYFFKANYRDHRKIVIIDEEIAFTGGINIGNEYLGNSNRGPWRDTSVEIRGPCVAQLLAVFQEAWSRTTGDSEIPLPCPAHVGNDIVNVISSGPDSDWYAIQRAYLEIIHQTNHHLIIQTPYFIPDAATQEALINTALRGVTVELFVPRYPDSQLFRWVAMTYIGDLLRAGVRVFEYPVGFLHQKVLISDSAIATIGTCNIDLRSFRLDFEVNVLFSAPDAIRHLIEDADRDRALSEELTYDTYLQRPFFTRIRGSLARLIGPLL